jgi:RNA polymerase sigma factor for flagellar operon FliA
MAHPVHSPVCGDAMTPTTKFQAETNPNLSERDALVLQHLSLVRAIAIRVHGNLPVHVDLDDLVHAGILGLFDAALKFNGEKQVTFRGYAKHRIKGAILDSLRNLDWASRDLRKRHKQLESVTHELASLVQRNPTETEIAEKMGMNLERWRQVSIDLRMVGLLSASSRSPEADNHNPPEFPAGDTLNPDKLTGRNELRAVLASAIRTLPERYQQVIGLYYMRGKTMREIGDELGVNESRVSQIHRAALDRMAVNLQEAGIRSPDCLL